MAPDKLANGAQCCCSKFDCRLFPSKFFQFAFDLSLSLSVISTSLAQPSCMCCNLSVSIVLYVQFTTNGMCVKNNIHKDVVRTSRNRMSTTSDLWFCLLLWWLCLAIAVARFIAIRSGCCCNLSVGVALKVRFTMNGMCKQSNTQIYVTRTSNNRVISSGDLHCCLLPQCEALNTCHSSFSIAI